MDKFTQDPRKYSEIIIRGWGIMFTVYILMDRACEISDRWSPTVDLRSQLWNWLQGCAEGISAQFKCKERIHNYFFL